MAGVTFVVAAAFAMVVFVVLADLVTVQLVRGAARAATDEAARAGSRSDAPVADCEARARAVLDGLLGPAARDAVGVTCAVSGSPLSVHARADVAVVPWLAGLPAWSFVVESDAVAEVLP